MNVVGQVMLALGVLLVFPRILWLVILFLAWVLRIPRNERLALYYKSLQEKQPRHERGVRACLKRAILPSGGGEA